MGRGKRSEAHVEFEPGGGEEPCRPEKRKLEPESPGGGGRWANLGTGYPYPRAIRRCATQGSGVGCTHPKKLQHEPLALRGVACSSVCS